MGIHKVRHQPVVVGEEDKLNHHPTMEPSLLSRTWVISVTKENQFDMKEVRHQPVVVGEEDELHHHLTIEPNLLSEDLGNEGLKRESI